MSIVARNNEEKTSGCVSLRYIVMNLLNRQKSYTMQDYKHLMQLTIDSVSYLNLITMDTVEVAYLEVGDTSALELPSDYLDYTKIAIVTPSLKTWTLTLNKDLIRFPVEECGLPLDAVLNGYCDKFPTQYPTPDYGYFFTEHFHDGNLIPKYFSVGGGFNTGYYNIDKQGRYLLLSGVPKGTTIVMEYKSTGIGVAGGTYIPRQAMEAVIAKVMWVETEYQNIPGDYMYWRQRFYDEERILGHLEYTRTHQEYLDTLYKQWKQSPKR